MNTPMKVVLIVAGMNEPSNSHVLADAFIDGIKDTAQVECTTFRLKNLTLEQFEAKKHYANPPQSNDDYYKIEKALLDAHAVVIASPVWNFSVPGHFKNFIDRLGAAGLDRETHSRGTFAGKPFYLVFTTGSPNFVWPLTFRRTLSHITEALKYCGASVIGVLHEGRCTTGRGTFGLVIDKRPQVLALARERGGKFARIVGRYVRTQTLPLGLRLKHQWNTFIYKIANRVFYWFSC